MYKDLNCFPFTFLNASLNLLRDGLYRRESGAEMFCHSIQLLQKCVGQRLVERVRRRGVHHPTGDINALQKVGLLEHYEFLLQLSHPRSNMRIHKYGMWLQNTNN
jgi:hypothetical protein